MMGRQVALRAPATALLLTRLGIEREVPAATCLRGTGLRLEDLERPEQQLTAEQELTIVSNLLDALGDPPGLGLDAGVRYHPTTLGMLGFATISSPTLRDAIEFAMRYADLSITHNPVTIREDGGLFYLLPDPSTVPVRLRRFLVERDLAAAAHVAESEALGRLRPCRVMFGFPPPPGGVRRYEDVFGLRPEFDAPEHGLAFESALLDRPLPQADAYAARMAEEECRRLVEQRLPRAGLAGQVRRVLLSRPQEPPGLDEVAGMLHLAPRTLRRRLAEEGVSYRTLLSEVRGKLAQELLLDGRLTVEEVAHRLGYAETSSFTHAFRRWTGQGPRAHRKAADASGGPPDAATTPLPTSGWTASLPAERWPD
jgi:AraC-like DNA-binding protein